MAAEKEAHDDPRHEPLHHHGRETAAKTLAFYCGLLGLKEGARPDLGFPGAWLYPAEGGAAVLHIYWDRPMPATRTGVIDHMAFTSSDLKAVKARFDESGTKYDLRQQAGAGTWQLVHLRPERRQGGVGFRPFGNSVAGTCPARRRGTPARLTTAFGPRRWRLQRRHQRRAASFQVCTHTGPGSAGNGPVQRLNGIGVATHQREQMGAGGPGRVG